MPQVMQKVVRALIFDIQGRVLLVQRVKPPDAGKWSLPGGKVEPKESLKETITREIKEELNLSFNPQASFNMTDDQSVPGTICEVSFWKGEADGEIEIKADEINAVRYFSQQDLSYYPIAFNHKKVLLPILKL